MKKIGFLHGREQLFSKTLIEKINNHDSKVEAAVIKLGALDNQEKLDYDIIIDRISNDVPFYRSVLKAALINGSYVINNPVWSGSEDQYFNTTLATKLGIKTPKSAILPSKEHPPGTNAEYMQNLEYPLNLEKVFNSVGFPSVIKSVHNSVNNNDFNVYNKGEFHSAYDLTGNSVMLLQEDIKAEECYSVFVIGQKDVRISRYYPRKPFHMRYTEEKPELSKKITKKITDQALKVNKALGLDFNRLEVSVKDDEPYFVDFMDTTPNLEPDYIKSDNFNWITERFSEFLISAAEKPTKKGQYIWSDFVK